MIIGGWRIKYLKARQKPAVKKHREYVERNERLPEMGYASYREYLKSEEWLQIKAKMLRRVPRCLTCERPAVVVHHMSYDLRTLLGLSTQWLVCMCHGCHERIEMDGKRKRSLKEANHELVRLAVEAGRHSWVGNIKEARKGKQRRDAADDQAGVQRQPSRRKKQSKKSQTLNDRPARSTIKGGAWVTGGNLSGSRKRKKRK